MFQLVGEKAAKCIFSFVEYFLEETRKARALEQKNLKRHKQKGETISDGSSIESFGSAASGIYYLRVKNYSIYYTQRNYITYRILEDGKR